MATGQRQDRPSRDLHSEIPHQPQDTHHRKETDLDDPSPNLTKFRIVQGGETGINILRAFSHPPARVWWGGTAWARHAPFGAAGANL